MATLAPLTIDELRDLLAHVIAGVAGGVEADWRKRIVIEPLYAGSPSRHDWIVKPSGTVRQCATIENVARIVRSEHPCVA